MKSILIVIFLLHALSPEGTWCPPLSQGLWHSSQCNDCCCLRSPHEPERCKECNWGTLQAHCVHVCACVYATMAHTDQSDNSAPYIYVICLTRAQTQPNTILHCKNCTAYKDSFFVRSWQRPTWLKCLAVSCYRFNLLPICWRSIHQAIACQSDMPCIPVHMTTAPSPPTCQIECTATLHSFA